MNNFELIHKRFIYRYEVDNVKKSISCGGIVDSKGKCRPIGMMRFYLYLSKEKKLLEI